MSAEARPGVGFLIGGLARSGTTLVQRLCCELSSVWVPPETHFWPSSEGLEAAIEFPLQGGARIDAVEQVARDLAGRGVGIQVSDVLESLAAYDRRIGLWTLFESVVTALSPPDRRMLGEKTPQHLLWWEQLSGVVPDLRFLTVVRDPRAALRSHRSVTWGETDAYALAERWLAYQRAATDALRLLGPERVLALRYEDVAAHPEGTRSDIARFLAVPDEVKLLTDDVLAVNPLFPGQETWKARALESVEAEQRPATEGPPAEDIRIIESICSPLMQAAGYEPGVIVDVGPPTGESRDRVTAFRRWRADIAASRSVAVY